MNAATSLDRVDPRSGWVVPLLLAVLVVVGGWIAFVVALYPERWQRTLPELAEEVDPVMARGEQQFVQLCVVCHAEDGTSLANMAPSLVGSRWVLGEPEALSRIMLDGMLDRQRGHYAGVMTGWRHLSDQDLAAVMTYVRRSWGNHARPVRPATVQAVREQTLERDNPWTEAELEAELNLAPQEQPAEEVDAEPEAAGSDQ